MLLVHTTQTGAQAPVYLDSDEPSLSQTLKLHVKNSTCQIWQRSLQVMQIHLVHVYCVCCSETVCAVNNTGRVQQADCLRRLDVSSLMSVFPWQSWLNEHFYFIPSPTETSTAIAVVDGNVELLLYCQYSSTTLPLPYWLNRPWSTASPSWLGLCCDFCICIRLLAPTVQLATVDREAVCCKAWSMFLKKYIFFPMMTPIDIRPCPCVTRVRRGYAAKVCHQMSCHFRRSQINQSINEFI